MKFPLRSFFFSKNITTGIAVAHARGVILCAAEEQAIPIYEYTPMRIKQAVVGYGLADKKQVMDMTRRILKLKAVPGRMMPPTRWPLLCAMPAAPPVFCGAETPM